MGFISKESNKKSRGIYNLDPQAIASFCIPPRSSVSQLEYKGEQKNTRAWGPSAVVRGANARGVGKKKRKRQQEQKWSVHYNRVRNRNHDRGALPSEGSGALSSPSHNGGRAHVFCGQFALVRVGPVRVVSVPSEVQIVMSHFDYGSARQRKAILHSEYSCVVSFSWRGL